MKAMFCALFAVALASCLTAEENLGAQRGSIDSASIESASPGWAPPSATASETIQSCGNSQCEAGERPETCPSDCSICGDGQCYPHEHGFCPEDCCFSTPEECGG